MRSESLIAEHARCAGGRCTRAARPLWPARYSELRETEDVLCDSRGVPLRLKVLRNVAARHGVLLHVSLTRRKDLYSFCPSRDKKIHVTTRLLIGVIHFVTGDSDSDTARLHNPL